MNIIIRLGLQKKLPAHNATDTQFTCKAMFFWTHGSGVKLHLIQPGQPTLNTFMKSFDATFREYCLDLNCFARVDDAKATIEDRRRHYNYIQPHQSIGSKPPTLPASEAA